MSSDRGLTWSFADLGVAIDTIGGVSAVAVDPADPLALYAGAECLQDCTAAKKIWRSHDGGATWQASSVGLASAGAGIKALAVEPGTHKVMASSGASLFFSQDGGATWQSLQGAEPGLLA